MEIVFYDIIIYVLCLVILALIFLLGCYLIKVVHSNAYQEKKIRKAEELYRERMASEKGKVKKFPENYDLNSEWISGNNQKSAS